jgi:hypothetical protein
MTLLAHVRSWVARHPRVYWTVVVGLALVAGCQLHTTAQQFDAATRAWGESVTVWVATADLAPGDPVAAQATAFPSALAAPGRLDRDPTGLVAVQHIGAGDVVRVVDIGRAGLDLLPREWRGVSIAVDSAALTLAPGTRVDVVAVGALVVADAVVVAVADGAVTVGVPADAAPAVADAAQHGEASLVVRSD